jgi:TRAP-type C4-dicarboxylate transport system substrate-binding protein
MKKILGVSLLVVMVLSLFTGCKKGQNFALKLSTVLADTDHLKGLRVRTMGSKVAQASMTAMGATPTSLAWSEAYSGLQQKVVDAVEAQLTAVYGASLHEVVKYISETGHFLLYTALVISEDWYQSLPEEYREIVVKASINAGGHSKPGPSGRRSYNNQASVAL